MLILCGGNVDSDGRVLRRIVDETRERGGERAKILICASSSGKPEEAGQHQAELFRKLGLRKVEQLDIRIRAQAMDPETVARLDGASTVFFTGGDQLRFTATVADSPVFQRIRELHQQQGLIIAGTSSGCAAISETMLIGGPGSAAPESDEISMAPGLGFVSGIVLDTHFAERGRIGRLLTVVAQNPKNLSIGIDENTAIVIEGDSFEVVGEGAVFVIDGAAIRFSSLSGNTRHGVTSIFGCALHVLSDGDRFDLVERAPDLERAERAAAEHAQEEQVAK